MKHLNINHITRIYGHHLEKKSTMLTQVRYVVIVFEIYCSEIFEDAMTEQFQQQISSLQHVDLDKSAAPSPLLVPAEVPDGSC